MGNKNNIKKICNKCGSLVAGLLIFSPLVIFAQYNDSLADGDMKSWILLISSIFYDIYWYNSNKKITELKSGKDHYNKWIKPFDKHNSLCKDMSDIEYYEYKVKSLEEHIENIYNIFED